MPSNGKGGAKPAEARADAQALQLLETLGLPASLLPKLSTWIKDGLSDLEVYQNLRETEAYKVRFKGLIDRVANGYNAMSEAEFLTYETQARELARMAGMSQASIDRYIHGAVANNVSNMELEKRIMDGYAAVEASSFEARKELERLYGVGSGDLLEFWLDPQNALDDISRRWMASQLSGSAVRTGFGGLTQHQAERVARLGVSQQEADQGFAGLAQSQELMTGLVGSGEEEITADEQIEAVFGNDAKANEKIQRRRDQRKAQFEGGGGALANQSGVVGLG